MTKQRNIARIITLAVLAFPFTGFGQRHVPEPDSLKLDSVQRYVAGIFNSMWFRETTGYSKQDSTKVTGLDITHKPRLIRIVTDRQLAEAPFREPLLDSIEKGISLMMGEEYADYRVAVYSGRKALRDCIPNYYRADSRAWDRQRVANLGRRGRTTRPLVQNLSKEYLSRSALFNCNIALWHSHGWYYEPTLNRWEWQRARIFQTVEDIYPMAFTLPFLVPMLENAGATVLMPRERDWQTNEVVVDNNGSTRGSFLIAPYDITESDDSTGFAVDQPPYVDENPFLLGTYMTMEAERKASKSIQWIPDIPEEGEYGVYISYHTLDKSPDDARYQVIHAGDTTEFSVNQQMGGGTWIYVGRFPFEKGFHPESGKVILTNESGNRSAIVSADAVRFGGGMGIISRNGLTSLRPRYQEAARYYLQYAGFPDTLVWKLNDTNDYNDDYQSRGEWVNFLMGTPRGPAAERQAKGLGIPVDLSFAFHTDAGISSSDTVIGTLGIFNTSQDGGLFPGGGSRMASRDLTDLVQTQIVADLRAKYDPAWTRRGLWDRGYSEAYRPNVPAMLLELFSHQNMLDMRFGQEPQFRFDVSRAIYKGMLRFLEERSGIEYIVQPLPVDHFSAVVRQDGSIRLQWQPVTDQLEPTATPEAYVVYTRINGKGFDNGTIVSDTLYRIRDPMKDSLYSFKVTALNRGGESFPSEVLSACKRTGSGGSVLVINAFDRTGGAAWFSDSRYAGFLPMVDQGVPWGPDLHTVGWQYDYLKDSPWLDDDSPGHGASSADLESRIIPGNSFDFSEVHGRSIARAGFSFSSASDESVIDGLVDLDSVRIVDYLAGEERTSYYPKNDTISHFQVFEGDMREILNDFLAKGGGLLISGAHIATDIHMNHLDSLVAASFKYIWRTSNASRLGGFYFTDTLFALPSQQFSFNTGIHPSIYTVEGADALEPADSTASTLIRYSENNMSGGVGYRGSYRLVAFGFPFECIMDQPSRDLIMRKVLRFITKPDPDE